MASKSFEEQACKTFASVFELYLQAAAFHWNVTGAQFYQLHKLLNDIYDDVYQSLDPFAEQLRTQNIIVPATLSVLSDLSQLSKFKVDLPALDMLTSLNDNNKIVIEALTKLNRLASDADLQGLVNFIGGRIEKHGAWSWMLESSLSDSNKQPTSEAASISPHGNLLLELFKHNKGTTS